MIAHLSTMQRMTAEQAAGLTRLINLWLQVFDTRVDPAELRLRAAGVIVSLATGPYRGQEPNWESRDRTHDRVRGLPCAELRQSLIRASLRASGHVRRQGTVCSTAVETTCPTGPRGAARSTAGKRTLQRTFTLWDYARVSARRSRVRHSRPCRAGGSRRIRP